MTKTQYIKDINMMNDALLKSLFRSIEAREMVASFLSAVTGISEESLMKAEYVDGEIPKRSVKNI